jgi:hypothetical protein
MRKRGTSRHYAYTKPSRKAIQAVKDKVTVKTYRSTLHQEPAVLIQGISQTLRGWAGYHRHGVSKAVFNAVDSHAWNRMMRWLRRKYQGRPVSCGPCRPALGPGGAGYLQSRTAASAARLARVISCQLPEIAAHFTGRAAGWARRRWRSTGRAVTGLDVR